MITIFIKGKKPNILGLPVSFSHSYSASEPEPFDQEEIVKTIKEDYERRGYTKVEVSVKIHN